jgi:hypothetical protein
MFTKDIGVALQIPVAATGGAPLCFGPVKGHFTGVSKVKSASQTLLVGALAAVRRIGSHIYSAKPSFAAPGCQARLGRAGRIVASCGTAVPWDRIDRR